MKKFNLTITLVKFTLYEVQGVSINSNFTVKFIRCYVKVDISWDARNG